VRRERARVSADTGGNRGLTVNLAIDYGGRDEILRAVNRLRADGREGRVGESELRAALDHPEIPDPDLIIRTGNEQRLSNFLLWQMAYAELYFSPKMWPDWAEEDLQSALRDFQLRERRFGTAPADSGKAAR